MSGADAAVTALAKSQLSDVCALALQHTALDSRRSAGRLFDAMQARVAAVPARELERIHRALQLEQSRLDATHPPTGYRLELLRAHGGAAQAITCSAAESQVICGHFTGFLIVALPLGACVHTSIDVTGNLVTFSQNIADNIFIYKEVVNEHRAILEAINRTSVYV